MSNPTDDSLLDGAPERTTLDQELTKLLNRYSRENASETPDYILADYMLGCLEAFERAVVERDRWHGGDAKVSGSRRQP